MLYLKENEIQMLRTASNCMLNNNKKSLLNISHLIGTMNIVQCHETAKSSNFMGYRTATELEVSDISHSYYKDLSLMICDPEFKYSWHVYS